jgi:hypothetical protein
MIEALGPEVQTISEDLEDAACTSNVEDLVESLSDILA